MDLQAPADLHYARFALQLRICLLLIRHETTATLWLSILSKLVWMQQTAES